MIHGKVYSGVNKWMESALSARFLVASLGETTQPAWWRSEATSAVGQRFLLRLFPRTALLAGLETASRAAAIEHDNHIGRVGAYHLFRLPIAEETSMLGVLRTAEAEQILQTVAASGTAEARLEALRALAGTEIATDAQGPVHCGTTAGLRRGKTLARLCAVYVDAFTTSRTAYPFLLEAAFA